LGTFTPTGTLPTATVNSDALAVGCNNLAFIRDVSIPAGTVIGKGQEFTKTWKVQNTGTCDWMYQYTLVLVGGEAYGGASTKIQKKSAGLELVRNHHRITSAEKARYLHQYLAFIQRAKFVWRNTDGIFCRSRCHPHGCAANSNTFTYNWTYCNAYTIANNRACSNTYIHVYTYINTGSN
jgi:hypothetical protein